MKKVIITLGTVIGIAIVVLVSLNLNHYSLDAIVSDKTNDNVIVIEDTTGNIWEYEDTENEYTIGDNITVTWNDKGTDFKQDDEIIKLEIK